MIIGVDKNQYAGSHGFSNRSKHKQMMDLGAELMPLKIPFGDYVKVDDDMLEYIKSKGESIKKNDLMPFMKLSIDTKKSLQELAQNVTWQHERFKKELIKPLTLTDAKLVILIEESGINSIEDVYFWQNPRSKKSNKAIKGESLFKSLCTIRDRYNVDFEFCSRKETGKRILERLKDG